MNKRHLAPNILVLVNHDIKSDCFNLLGFLTGGTYVGSSFIVDLSSYRTSGIREEISTIDSIISFQDEEDIPQNIIFTSMDYQQHLNRLFKAAL